MPQGGVSETRERKKSVSQFQSRSSLSRLSLSPTPIQATGPSRIESLPPARRGSMASAPRLHHQLAPDSVFAEDWAAPGGGGLVERVPATVTASLKARGHSVKPAQWGGVVQAILVPPPGEPGGEGGQGRAPLEAASDPRKDGAPAAA